MLRRLVLLAMACAAPPGAHAELRRVVILKLDGVPAGLVERYARERFPLNEPGRAGKPRLPWIGEVFLRGGVSFENFYVRGISLSAPSWAALDTGVPGVIHGNAEFDRYTLRGRDYLNFFPFYVNYARKRRADMPGVEVVDEAGVPLLLDYFGYGRASQSFQLLQRGVRFESLRDGLINRFKSRSPLDLVDEWQTGFSMSAAVSEQAERDLLSALGDPEIHYLDLFNGDFDHVAHLTADAPSQRETLEKIDAQIGRIWTAIQRTPWASETLFVVVSDHGMNSDAKVYSQGFSLIRLFNSAEAGGHHVLTNRHPLTQFKLRGLDPFVSKVTTASDFATYLTGQQDSYPTVVLDLDGNERAGVYLRSNALNRLHIMLDSLNRGLPRSSARASLVERFLAESREWARRVEPELDAMRAELHALSRWIASEEIALAAEAQRPKAINAPKDVGAMRDQRRRAVRLDSWKEDARGYEAYVHAVGSLLSLGADRLEPGKLKPSEVIPRNVLGPRNTVRELRRYAVNGTPEGGLREVDILHLLTSQRVRNNVQAGVSANPVDLVAVRVDPAWLPGAESLDTCVLLYRDARHQALIQSRAGMLRYLPAANFDQDADLRVRWETPELGPGFPLELFEDGELRVDGSRADWLASWHTEREWLRAVHRTRYSNGVIGLASYFAEPDLAAPVDSPDGLLARLNQRRQRLRAVDLLVFANDHWNFNVRGFNPGGNHGGLFRPSTHSVWMMAGEGLPRGLRVEEPYDSLSFLPTVLKLLGIQPRTPLPGAPVEEILK